MSPLDSYRNAYKAGYFYGRIDALNGAPYDDRTVLERGQLLSEGNTVECKNIPESTGETGNHPS
ncbi:hypothetical protein CHH67_22550 [Paenibacillus campinasensis]|uniref:Uncharacterized protein n=1 Tax=Paenibacillus campinasensis TaxID=66347 RepID=A0A268EH75_9BACL|nr:hypothetical protein CHH67_22550 [Paenibacillus campinasensis]